MEKKQKTYQATNYIQLDTYTLVDGKAVLIEFRGGSLEHHRNGIYSTTDPKVMGALDADIKRVGIDKSSFKCIHEEVLINDDENETDVLTDQEVPDIKTVTAAKQWLIEASEQGIIKKGITPSMIKNRTDVLTIAGENKINFIDLPKE
jgi:hypothetical protein